MKTLLRQQTPANAAEQAISTEFVRLIRKLRWIGMEDEAERVQIRLAACQFRPWRVCSEHRWIRTSGMNQTLGTLVSVQNTHRTGITAGLKRMIFATS